MPYTDDYITRRKSMLADAEAEDAADSKKQNDIGIGRLSPYVESESKKVMQNIGDVAGKAAMGAGALALGVPVTAPVSGPAAVGLGLLSGGMYAAEGLTDARQGRPKEGAAKIAAGLIEGALTTKPGIVTKPVVLAKGAAKKAAASVAPYVEPVSRSVGLDAAIAHAQDMLRQYADSTSGDDFGLSSALRSLSDDPAQLRAIATSKARQPKF